MQPQPTAPAPAPVRRSRVLASDVLITQAGQFQALETLLPDTAQRITGLYAAATLMPGRRYHRRDAFVVFGLAPTNGSDFRVATAPVSAAGDNTTVGFAIESGYLMADSEATFYANRGQFVGFYLPLTDEVPLKLLRVDEGMIVYYGHTVTLGRPKLVDSEGNLLDLIYEIGKEKVETMFSQYYDTPAVVYSDSLAHLCRVTLLPNAGGQDFIHPVSGGYINGLLFPGDPNRY